MIQVFNQLQKLKLYAPTLLFALLASLVILFFKNNNVLIQLTSLLIFCMTFSLSITLYLNHNWIGISPGFRALIATVIPSLFFLLLYIKDDSFNFIIIVLTILSCCLALLSIDQENKQNSYYLYIMEMVKAFSVAALLGLFFCFSIFSILYLLDVFLQTHIISSKSGYRYIFAPGILFSTLCFLLLYNNSKNVMAHQPFFSFLEILGKYILIPFVFLCSIISAALVFLFFKQAELPSILNTVFLFNSVVALAAFIFTKKQQHLDDQLCKLYDQSLSAILIIFGFFVFVFSISDSLKPHSSPYSILLIFLGVAIMSIGFIKIFPIQHFLKISLYVIAVTLGISLLPMIGGVDLNKYLLKDGFKKVLMEKSLLNKKGEYFKTPPIKALEPEDHAEITTRALTLFRYYGANSVCFGNCPWETTSLPDSNLSPKSLLSEFTYRLNIHPIKASSKRYSLFSKPKQLNIEGFKTLHFFEFDSRLDVAEEQATDVKISLPDRWSNTLSFKVGSCSFSISADKIISHVKRHPNRYFRGEATCETGSTDLILTEISFVQLKKGKKEFITEFWKGYLLL